MLIVGPINLMSVSQLPHFPCNVSSPGEAMLCGRGEKGSKPVSASVNDSAPRSLACRKKNLSGADKSLLPSMLKEPVCSSPSSRLLVPAGGAVSQKHCATVAVGSWGNQQC